jgi:flagellar biosynthesis protein FlhA
MDALFQFLKRYEKYSKNTDVLMAAGLLMILGVMLIPLPPWMLDFSLTLSLSASLLVLLVSIYSTKALEFSVFPSLLLLTTLFRLSLNVASTRVILSNGHQGEGAAGQVINAFGSVVVGDNYIIGLVVFIILVVINFVVITKGSGRVAEVAARFTLDAMPGKQMSIDADLNSGLISEEEARNRRKEIEQEADFYGSMDGASKFVRGDAIAGIVITLVNILGGLLVGVLQRDLDFATAAQYYTMLTIGDGLVGQIPALIISTAAGTVVTKSSAAGENMGTQIAGQLFANPKVLYMGGGVIGLLSLVPGLPLLPFFTISGGLIGLGWMLGRFQQEETARKAKEAEESISGDVKENIESLLPLDLVELEIGYGLINIVESNESGDLLERIVSIRKQFAVDMGIIVPSVHIRDNLQLEPGEYRVLIKGNKVAGGELRPDSLLAMDPGDVMSEVEGVPTKEPAFGLDALWINPALKEDAEISGYTVVDLPTVMATHLTEVIRMHAHELLGRQEASQLIDSLKKNYPKVVEETIPDIVPLGTVVKVLKNLLSEQVSIRDMLTIIETLSDEGSRSKDPEILTEAVRKALARSITAKFAQEGEIPVMSFHPNVEELVSNSLLQSDQGVQLVMDPRTAQQIITEIANVVEMHPEFAGQPVLLTSPTIRRHIQKLTSRFIPQLAVLSHSEVTSDARVNSVGTVELTDAG